MIKKRKGRKTKEEILKERVKVLQKEIEFVAYKAHESNEELRQRIESLVTEIRIKISIINDLHIVIENLGQQLKDYRKLSYQQSLRQLEATQVRNYSERNR